MTDPLQCIKPIHKAVLDRARTQSRDLLSRATTSINQYLVANGQSPDGMCFAAVGSVGRGEALEASDLDIVPIAANAARLEQYVSLDADLRRRLRQELDVHVSKGADLTKSTSVEELVEADSIGGTQDTSGRLTKRVLLLTESAQAGGTFPLCEVRRALLEAYAKEERTSGRHILAFCNDVARYYKLLCIEYKAKVDDQDKDWCTRNVKLRHSRKLWYFSNIIAIATMADRYPQGDSAFRDALLASLDAPPVERLAAALSHNQPLALGRLLESYALFLQFMSVQDNRDALKNVLHGNRYEMAVGNPFPAMKFNSDLLHGEIIAIIEQLGPAMRARIMSWFML